MGKVINRGSMDRMTGVSYAEYTLLIRHKANTFLGHHLPEVAELYQQNICINQISKQLGISAPIEVPGTVSSN